MLGRIKRGSVLRDLKQGKLVYDRVVDQKDFSGNASIFSLEQSLRVFFMNEVVV
jgi:hypothetical protein